MNLGLKPKFIHGLPNGNVMCLSNRSFSDEWFIDIMRPTDQRVLFSTKVELGGTLIRVKTMNAKTVALCYKNNQSYYARPVGDRLNIYGTKYSGFGILPVMVEAEPVILSQFEITMNHRDFGFSSLGLVGINKENKLQIFVDTSRPGYMGKFKTVATFDQDCFHIDCYGKYAVCQLKDNGLVRVDLTNGETLRLDINVFDIWCFNSGTLMWEDGGKLYFMSITELVPHHIPLKSILSHFTLTNIGSHFILTRYSMSESGNELRKSYIYNKHGVLLNVFIPNNMVIVTVTKDKLLYINRDDEMVCEDLLMNKAELDKMDVGLWLGDDLCSVVCA